MFYLGSPQHTTPCLKLSAQMWLICTRKDYWAHTDIKGAQDVTKIIVIQWQGSFFGIRKWKPTPLPTSEARWISENGEGLREKRDVTLAWSAHERWSPKLHRNFQHLANTPTVLWVTYRKFNNRKSLESSGRQHFHHLFVPGSPQQHQGNKRISIYYP